MNRELMLLAGSYLGALREHVTRKLDIHDTGGLTRHAFATGIIASSVQLTTV